MKRDKDRISRRERVGVKPKREQIAPKLRGRNHTTTATTTRPQTTAQSPEQATDRSLTINIDGLSPDGIGVGRLGQREVLVFGSYPGERVVCDVIYRGQTHLTCELRDILLPSPHRIASPCRDLNKCQACPLISLDYAEQLRLKTQWVRDAFGERGLGDVQIQDSLAAEMPLGYRATVKLSFAKSQGVIKLGLYRRGTHQVVDLKNCPLHHPLINRIVSAVRAEANHQRISVYDPKCDQGLLRYLLVRVSPALNKAMVTFVVTEKDIRRLMPMAKWLQRKIPEVVSIHQNINDTEGNAIIGRETSRLLGVSDLFDVVGDIRVRTSPTAFVQVNHEQAARIYRMVSEWSELSAEQLAVDLYCGIGGISLHLARRAKQVVCIEMQPDAVRNAIDNAKFNDLHNCRFIAGNAVELLDTLELPPQTVAVVNPPRKGCEHQLLKAIAHSPITRLIYVSCCPETLARDVATLCKQGLVLQRVQPVDMFPQTPHVETVALLTR